MAERGIRPSRARGQNFVADPNTIRRVVRLAGVGPGDRVVEVGAGTGQLTLALCAAGAEVLAIEIDRRLVGILREVVPASVRVVEADAMDMDWDGVLAGGGGGDGAGDDDDEWALVANLPYNVATPLVADLLDHVPAVTRMLVMVQREVAERLAAVPGGPGYGAVSVKVAYWARAKVVGRVPPTVFLPAPNVESALVEIVRRDRPAVPDVDRGRLFELVAAGFGQRRKMLRRSLSGLVDPGCFAAAGVRPESRAEELDVAAWARLALCTRSTLPPS